MIRTSFGNETQQLQPSKKTLFHQDSNDLTVLPDKLKKYRDQMMNKSSSVRDRLAVSSLLLKDCKVLNKNGEFKLSQEKVKLELLSNLDSMQLKVLLRFLYDVY